MNVSSKGEEIRQELASQHHKHPQDTKSMNIKVSTSNKRKKGDDTTSTTTSDSRKKLKTGKLKDDRDYEEETIPERNNSKLSTTSATRATTEEESLYVYELMDQIFGNLDLASVIFTFLGVRGLYNFVMTNKQYIQILKYEHVIRTAMFSGKHVKTSIENLIPLIKARKIWIPTPLRLLRLVNGQRCERCNKNNVNIISKHFGVFYCRNAHNSCIQVGMNQSKDNFAHNLGRNNKWGAFLDHERVLSQRSGRSSGFVWISTVKDTSGKPYGPLVTKDHMEDILEDLNNNNEYQDIGGKEGVVKVVKTKKKKMEATPEEKKKAVDKLLKKLDEQDPESNKNVKAILVAYEDCFVDANSRAVARNKELQHKKKTANNKSNYNRRVKTIAWINKLYVLVGEVPWKDVILKSYRFEPYNARSDKIIAKFNCPVVDEVLRPLSLAPSKASGKKLQELTAKLKDDLDVIWSTGFHNFSFLNESIPYERFLLNYFRSRNDNDVTIREVGLEPIRRIDILTLFNIKEGKLHRAMHLIYNDEIKTAVSARFVGTLSIRDEHSRLVAQQFAESCWNWLDWRRGFSSNERFNFLGANYQYKTNFQHFYRTAQEQDMLDNPYDFFDSSPGIYSVFDSPSDADDDGEEEKEAAEFPFVNRLRRIIDDASSSSSAQSEEEEFFDTQPTSNVTARYENVNSRARLHIAEDDDSSD